MSEESRAQEKPEAPKSWASGPLMEKLSLSVEPAKFFEWPDRATMQRIEELQRATQPWPDLMSPTIATLNEINQRAADAAGEVNRILEQQGKLFQFEVNSALLEQSRALDQAANQFASALLRIDCKTIGREHSEGAKELAKRGWFISLDSPSYFHAHFLELVGAGRWEECERELETKPHSGSSPALT
jgi:hypothetical protein